MTRGKRALFAIGVATLLASCTNNLNLNSRITANTITTPPAATGSDGSGTFPLVRVVKNTSSATPYLLDLIGDGSGTFGQICVPQDGTSNTATSTTVCSCKLEYTNPASGLEETPEVPVVYHETNLVRCSYSGIPSGVNSFKISIHATTADIYSNEVTYTLGSATGQNLDASNPSSFSRVIRYQCRDIIQVPYLFDSNIYDPFQSEDIHLTYPLNFYTMDLGKAITIYSQSFSSIQGLEKWNCPPILNPNEYLTGDPNDPSTPLAKYNSFQKMNMKIFSKAPLGSSSLIYPVSAGGFDRYNFYLAKQPTGAFTVPVNSLISPGVNTSTAAVTPYSLDPLGYAANPIPIGTSGGNETCPDTATKPPGYHWVKVWLFRSSLPERRFKKSDTLTQKIGTIYCNPGDWQTTSSSTNLSPIFTGCFARQSTVTSQALTCNINGSNFDPTRNYSLSLDDIDAFDDSDNPVYINNNAPYLADRYLAGSFQCVRLQDTVNSDQTSATCRTNSTGTRFGPGCNKYDVWGIQTPGKCINGTARYPTAQQVGCAGGANSTVSDPLNLCNQTLRDTDGYVNSSTLNPTTNEAIPPTVVIDNSRFDYLFVVSPPSITLSHMQDKTSSTGLPYQPVRYKADSDCTAANPNACSTTNLLTYEVTTSDIGTNPDASTGDSTQPRTGAFPVCALQPD
jgi:hypothetical protein